MGGHSSLKSLFLANVRVELTSLKKIGISKV